MTYLLALLVFLLETARLFSAAPKPKYSGHCASDGTLPELDSLTTAERDADSAAWLQR